VKGKGGELHGGLDTAAAWRCEWLSKLLPMVLFRSRIDLNCMTSWILQIGGAIAPRHRLRGLRKSKAMALEPFIFGINVIYLKVQVDPFRP
jgi:hypothetical protein